MVGQQGTEEIEIKVVGREPGKSISRGLRSERQIPAVVYGPKINSLLFSMREIDAVKYSSHIYENTIFKLSSDDNPKLNGLKVLKKDIDVHPASQRPVHLDFYALDMTQSVRVNVEIQFTGKSKGVTEGGILNAIRREVEVECLPTDIPESFELDVTDLELNHSMHVSDIKVPEGIRMITAETEALVTVAQVKEEEAAPVEAAEAEAAPAAKEAEAKKS